MNNKLFLIGILVLGVLILGCTGPKITEPEVTESTEEQVIEETPSEETVEEEVEETEEIAEEEEEESGPVEQPSTGGKMFLITDKENSRVLELDSDGDVFWMYGCTSVNTLGYCDYGADLLNKPHHASYIGSNVLITDKDNNRVIEVNKDKDIVWTYGGPEGYEEGELTDPNAAIALSNGNVLIADGWNHRIIEVTKDKEVVWQYGCSEINPSGKCSYGTDQDFLRNPNYAEKLSDGNVLITDTENNRIIEVNEDKETVWEFRSGLNIPQSAHRTSGGTTIIANYRNNEILEVNEEGEVIWEFTDASIPTFAVTTPDGILITDSFNNRIIEVDNNKNILVEINDTDEEDKPLFPIFRPQAAVLR